VKPIYKFNYLHSCNYINDMDRYVNTDMKRHTQQPSSEVSTGALPVGCIANVVMHVGESEGGLVPLSTIKKAHLGGGIT